MRFFSLQKTYLKFYLLFLRPYSNIFCCLTSALLLFSFSPSIEALLLRQVIEILGKMPSDTMGFFYILNQHVLISSVFNMIVSSIREYLDALYHVIIPKLKKEILYNLSTYVLKDFGYNIQDYFGGYVLNTAYITAEVSNNIICSILYNFIFFLMNIIFPIFLIYTVNPPSAFIPILGSIFIIIFIYMTSSGEVLTSSTMSVKYTYTIREIFKKFTNIIFEKILYMKRTGAYFSLYENESDHEIPEKESRRNILLKLILEISSMFFICFQIYVLTLQRQTGGITIGDFIFILTLSLSVIGTSWDITCEYIFIYNSIIKCSKLIYFIMNKRNDTYRKKILYIDKGEVHFRNLSFSYEERKDLFLNLFVRIKDREKVGILGNHGSGKTTFISLMLNQIKSYSGSILIDGQDIKNVTQESLQKNICFIPNNPIFFQRTLIENILFGCPHATEEEAMKCAEKAKLTEFINSLPNGYHTPLREIENGFTNLQRKKLAFARILIKNPKILVLDERSSHADLETEIYIRNVLEQTEGKTLLIVTQQPGIAHLMDRLLIFNDGTIVEEGTPESLLERGGLYKELCEKALHPTNL